MTLCISWVRKLKSHEELLIATDSRLRAFGSWNCCPKILTFPRTDCAICFEGDTSFAYPMMIQLQTSVANYPRAMNRSQDLFDFKGHILKILNDMLKYKSDYELPETSFLFGGYSWKKDKFALWHLHYQKHYEKFTHRPISFWRGVKGEIKVTLTGDYTDDAKTRLLKILKERDKLMNGSLDMEPFEVLRDMLKEGDEEKYPLIGGAPQLIKVYRHMNRTPIAVKWNFDDHKILSLLGRPLLDYEKTSFPILDPETLEIQRSEIIVQ
jgi:hypothetical protein